ncbi:MAG: hypothetical protein JNL74_01765, partial [Fibrobacteres bacterium]|nr:hypothetical protein [Fibrobacterota bacterium]
MIKIIKFVVAFTSVSLFAQTAIFTVSPKRFAFYPRGADDSAVVSVRGTLAGAGVSQLTVTVYRDGIPADTISIAPAYSGTTAPFSFAPKIKAECAEYSLVLRADAVELARFDSLVAGDAYLIDGQSNAVSCPYGTPTMPLYKSEWFRSFSGSSWSYAQSATCNSAYAVGVWASMLGQKLIENHHIPICIINKAVGSTYISQHLSNNMLSAAVAAGVDKSVKAVFWHQGEADAGGSYYLKYADDWATMTNKWRADFPALQKIYAFQPQGTSQNVREIYRSFPYKYSDNVLISLHGTPGANGVHYIDSGYQYFANYLYPLLARDFYGSVDTAGIKSPDIKRLFFGNETGTEVFLEFDQPLVWPADSAGKSLKNMIKLSGFNGTILSGISTLVCKKPCIKLTLSAPCTSSMITYLQDASYSYGQTAPFLRNSRKVPALSFSNFPITFYNPDPNDTLTPASVAFMSTPATIEQYASCRLAAIVTYAGGFKDTTTKGCLFTSLDTLVASVSPWGVVNGLNTGTARIRVEKRGNVDTLEIVVTPYSATLDSIRLNIETSKLFVGKKLSLLAKGYFHSGSTTFSVNVTPSALWSVDSSLIAGVERGVVTALRKGGPARIVATLADKKDTIIVTVFDEPSLIRRVNFQASTIPFKTGWVADNGASYTSTSGYGWQNASIVAVREDRLGDNFLLKSFVNVSSGNWKIDLPAGEYIIKAAMGDNQYGAADSLWYGTETLLADGAKPNAFVTDTITVTGTDGMTLKVKGALNYVVIIPNEGIDINLVADDNGIMPPFTTPDETGAAGLTPQ